MRKVPGKVLEQILELSMKTSNLNQTFILQENYIVGADSAEHYQFAKFDDKNDAAFAMVLIPVGKEIVRELVQLREQARWIPTREKLPTKDGKYSCLEDRQEITLIFEDSDWWFRDDGGYLWHREPSHWRASIRLPYRSMEEE